MDDLRPEGPSITAFWLEKIEAEHRAAQRTADAALVRAAGCSGTPACWNAGLRPEHAANCPLAIADSIEAGAQPTPFTLARFADLALGARFRYPGSPQVWVKLGREPDGPDAVIASWEPAQATAGWRGQSICCFGYPAEQLVEYVA